MPISARFVLNGLHLAGEFLKLAGLGWRWRALGLTLAASSAANRIIAAARFKQSGLTQARKFAILLPLRNLRPLIPL